MQYILVSVDVDIADIWRDSSPKGEVSSHLERREMEMLIYIVKETIQLTVLLMTI